MLTFRLRPGVDLEAFRTADERVQTQFYYQQPGCLRRSLGRRADGRWLALTVWRDEGSASAATAAFETSAVCAELVELIEDREVEYFAGVD